MTPPCKQELKGRTSYSSLGVSPSHVANPSVTRQDLVTELRRLTNRCIDAHSRFGRRPRERRVPQSWRIVRKAARPRLLVLVISLELTAIPERDLDADATGQFSLVIHVELKEWAIDVLSRYLRPGDSIGEGARPLANELRFSKQRISLQQR